MKLRAEVTKVHYCVEVPKKFILLLSKDEKIDESLTKSLEHTGAEDLQWGGHFGPYIYFSASGDTDRTADDIRDDVIETLEYYLSPKKLLDLIPSLG